MSYFNDLYIINGSDLPTLLADENNLKNGLQLYNKNLKN